MGDVINVENAKEQLDMWFDSYDFDLNDIADEQTKAVAISTYNSLVRMVQKGRMQIVEREGAVLVEQFLKYDYEKLESPVVYAEMTARKEIAINKAKDDDAAILNTMQALCNNSNPHCLEVLRSADLSLMKKIGLFFRLM